MDKKTYEAAIEQQFGLIELYVINFLLINIDYIMSSKTIFICSASKHSKLGEDTIEIHNNDRHM